MATMTSDDFERGTGPNAEARSNSFSDWFFRTATTILNGVDTQLKATYTVSNGQPNYGVGPNGEIYIQGTNTTTSGQNTDATASASLSPALLILGAVALYFVLKKG